VAHKQKYKYSNGDKVWLIHLKEMAIITRFDKQGLIYVRLGKDEIPVFLSDIKPYKEPVSPLVNTENTPSVKEPEANYFKYHFDKSKFNNSGVLLIFIPETIDDGEVIHYDVFLVNDTRHNLEITYKLICNYGLFEQGKHYLKSTEYISISHFNAEHINEMQQFECLIKPEGEAWLEEKIIQKFSASSFIKKQVPYEPLKRLVYQYKLPGQFKQRPKVKDYFAQEDEEIFEINANLLKTMMLEKPVQKEYDVIIPEKEVDLHIEKITADTKGLSNTDILLLQLSEFNKALDRAIRSGQKVFYAIHGNGSGKLKKEIHKILSTHSEVVSYSNDYEPNYGYGATKIILR
jgi:hypothetical protein